MYQIPAVTVNVRFRLESGSFSGPIVFVAPGSQRRGGGRVLMDHVRASRDYLEVEVFEANEIGRAFYDAYGFERTGDAQCQRCWRHRPDVGVAPAGDELCGRCTDVLSATAATTGGDA